MNEAPRIYPNLSDETQFKRDKINEIKDSFIDEIRERETMSSRLSKYIAAFDYLQFFYLQQLEEYLLFILLLLLVFR